MMIIYHLRKNFQVFCGRHVWNMLRLLLLPDSGERSNVASTGGSKVIGLRCVSGRQIEWEGSRAVRTQKQLGRQNSSCIKVIIKEKKDRLVKEIEIEETDLKTGRGCCCL